MDVRAAEADVRVADVDVRAAEADVRAADVDVRAADVDVRAAEADVRVADVDVRAAEADVRAADVDVRAADVDVRAAEADVRVADVDVRAAEADVRAAEADVRAAEADVRAAEADVRAAEADVRAAEADVRAAEADVRAAEVDVGRWKGARRGREKTWENGWLLTRVASRAYPNGCTMGNRARSIVNTRGLAVEGAYNSPWAAVDDVRVDHRGSYVLMAEQGLDRTDIGACFRKVGGEAVARGVATCAAIESRSVSSSTYRPLHYRVTEMPAYDLSDNRIGAGSRRREHVLPREAGGSTQHLPTKRVRQVSLAATHGEIDAVQFDDGLELVAQPVADAGWQQRRAVACALATAHGDLVTVEVDVFHTQGDGFVRPQSRVVEKLAHEGKRRLEPVEQRQHVGARENSGEVLGTPRTFKVVKGGHGELENPAVEKHQRAKSLVLSGHRGVMTDRKVVEKRRHVSRGEVARLAALMKANKIAPPVDVRLLRARRVVKPSNCCRQRFDQSHWESPGAAGREMRRGEFSELVGRSCGLKQVSWARGGRGAAWNVLTVDIRELGRQGRGGLTLPGRGYAFGRQLNEMLDAGKERRPDRELRATNPERATVGPRATTGNQLRATYPERATTGPRATATSNEMRAANPERAAIGPRPPCPASNKPMVPTADTWLFEHSLHSMRRHIGGPLGSLERGAGNELRQQNVGQEELAASDA